MTYKELSELRQVLGEMYLITAENKDIGLECIKNYLIKIDAKIKVMDKAISKEYERSCGNYTKAIKDIKVDCRSGKYNPI